MGAKQSGPAATNGRTRAYSGGDLPSGGGGSGVNGSGGRPIGRAMRYTHLAPGAHHAASGSSMSSGAATAAPPLAAPRSRSLGGPTVSGTRTAHSAFNIPNSSGLYGSQDSVSSTPEEGGRERATASGGAERPGERSGGPRVVIGSLPAHLSPHLFGATAAAPEGDESRSYPNCTSSTQKSATPSSCKDGDSTELGDPKTHSYSAVESYLLPQLSPHSFETLEEKLDRFKCPVCSKFISSEEMDLHLVMCLTKPRITYNEDVLSKDAGECAICLEVLQQGDTIARLPCLCIYHKGCIDEWFEVNRSCPEHPSD